MAFIRLRSFTACLVVASLEPFIRFIGLLTGLGVPGAEFELERRLRGYIFGYLRFGHPIKLDRNVRLEGVSKITLGRDSRLYAGCQLVCGTLGSISIGTRSHIGRGTIVSGSAGIEIGKDCAISGLVAFYTSSNTPNGGYNRGMITLGDSVFVGANSTILPGIVVGDRASIGANSVVTNDLPDNSVAVGAPAQVKYHVQ